MLSIELYQWTSLPSCSHCFFFLSPSSFAGKEKINVTLSLVRMRTNLPLKPLLIDGEESNENVIRSGTEVLNARRRWGNGSWMLYITVCKGMVNVHLQLWIPTHAELINMRCKLGSKELLWEYKSPLLLPLLSLRATCHMAELLGSFSDFSFLFPLIPFIL